MLNATNRNVRQCGWLRASLTMAMALVVAVAANVAHAQSIRFVRDAETEALLRDYASPILRAAGLNARDIQIYVVPDRNFNAFVTDNSRIFMNVGVILQSETPNEVIGVLAHEAGHIAGGDLAQLAASLNDMRAAQIVTTILAGAAAVASGNPNAGAAIALGGQQAMTRSLLSYRRGQESRADRRAVDYLNATGQSSRGLLETFTRLADQMRLSTRFIDPYAITHPLPDERVIALERLARQSPHFDKRDSDSLQLRHNLVRAKISAYFEQPSRVQRRYPSSDNSLPAAYARAILRVRGSDYRGALSAVDQLIAAAPNYAYFHEFKGEILVSAGQPAAAVAPLQRAAQLAPDNPTLKVTLAQAMLGTGDAGLLEPAVRNLRQVTAVDGDHAEAFRQLALAYGRLNRIPEAELATAQAHMAQGEYDTARSFAARAQRGLSTGTPAWIAAQDIINFRPPR